MKCNKIVKAAALFAAVLALGIGCKNSSSGDDPEPDSLAGILDGAKELDGEVTASFAAAEFKAGDDGAIYLYNGVSGTGRFEVKCADDWTKAVTKETMSLVAAGDDKIAKLLPNLQGAARQYEFLYNFSGADKNISASTWTTKIYIPEAYAAAGMSAYPVLQFMVKNTAWTGKTIAQISAFDIGSGWHAIALDFANQAVKIDGKAFTSSDVTFGAASASDLSACKGVDLGLYGEALPSGMTGEFYLDYLDLTGFASPVLAAPAIVCEANTVTITAPSVASIYYTTDVTDPTSSSAKYTAPFAITETKTVKAVAMADGYENSAVISKVCAWVDPNVVDLYEDAAGTLYPFASTVQSFALDGYGEGSVEWKAEETSVKDGVLVVKRGAATAKTPVVCMTNSSPLNITGKTISFRIYIPASYVTEGTMGIKFFFKNSAWSYFGNWTGVNNGTIAGGWNTITLAVNGSNFTGATAADTDTVNCVGIEFDPNNTAATVADDILIDWIDIK